MHTLTANRRSATADLLEQRPELSNRAIARLAGVSPHTVAKLRNGSGPRYEADGRRARGARPTPRSEPEEQLPYGNTVVYRCYAGTIGTRAELLYIGVSMMVLQRLAAHHARTPWYHEIATIKLTHYPSRQAALRAERSAIRRENPRYNRQIWRG